jgi:hypothetical protein
MAHSQPVWILRRTATMIGVFALANGLICLHDFG